MSRLVAMLCGIILTSFLGLLQPVAATNYSAGLYGACSYESCSIGLSSSGSVALVLTPVSSSTTCSVQSDSVTATTGSSTGYLVTMNDDNTNNSMLNGGNAINAVSGTAASPVSLTTSSWGYRIDSVAGFGAGPTGAVTNGSTPALTFAAVPLSTATADTVRYTTTADTGTVSTSVWYGACVNASPTSGSYSDSVVYTAVVN